MQNGCDVNAASLDGMTPLFVAAGRGQKALVTTLMEGGAKRVVSRTFFGLTAEDAAREMNHSSVLRMLHNYESHFGGKVLPSRGIGIECTVSWPGQYARSWDAMVELAQNEGVSAAVVFMPENTVHYGT
jgi:hypothetical protein